VTQGLLLKIALSSLPKADMQVFISVALGHLPFLLDIAILHCYSWMILIQIIFPSFFNYQDLFDIFIEVSFPSQMYSSMSVRNQAVQPSPYSSSGAVSPPR
jgi:hypothetical protein